MADIPLLPKFSVCPRSDNSSLIDRVHHADIMELCQAVGEGSVDMILCDLPYG